MTLKHITTYILSCCTTALLLTGCGNSTDANLEELDSLLCHDMIDSAYTLYNNMPAPNASDRGNTAYYTLLKTELFYRKDLPIINDSIDYSLFYYEQHGPKRKLARAYYYKGVTLFFVKNDIKNAIMLLKKAENVAQPLNDITLLHKIYESICYINLIGKNYPTALSYADKAAQLAQKASNNTWLAYSLTYKANAYSGLALPDSNLKYLLKSLDYYRYLNRENQAVLLSNISDSYNSRQDFSKAEAYIKQAIKVKPNPYSYAILSEFYTKRGEYKKAYEALQHAIDSTDVYTQEKVLYNMLKLKKQMGDYKGAVRIADSLFQFNDKQEMLRQQNNIREIQTKYDIENRRQSLRTYRYYTVGLLIILVLTVVTFVFYHKYKTAKARQKLIEKHLLLNQYSGQISHMKTSQAETDKELSALRQKVSALKDNEVQTLSNGKILYESIVDNGNTLHWSNQDFLDFLAYFKLVDLAYVNQLENKYKNLSPKQYLFLIATEQLGKSEKDIETIMAISPGSIRSVKSRIKAKLITFRPAAGKQTDHP